MKTEMEINDLIIAITMKIEKDYPELSKYLVEVPVKNHPTGAERSVADLQDYYSSLFEIVKEYSETHQSIKH